MKKIIMVALASVAMGFAFAEGEVGSAWDVNGYFRTGVEGNLDAKDAETKVYKDGQYYGNGKSRARLNINFTQEEYGFKFRYQCDGFGLNNADTVTTKSKVLDKNGDDTTNYIETKSTKETWFTQDNLKYMMGYAKFYDGKIIAEAGKLMDFYTNSEARYEYQAMGGYGARAVFIPVEGLYLSAAGSTYRADKFAADDDSVKDGKAKAGDIKLNKKLVTLSAKYKNKDFAIAGGHNFAGESYGFFALKSIQNLKFNIEAKYLDKEISGKTNDDGEKTAMTEAWELINYNFKGLGTPLEVGVYCHQVIVKDDTSYEFYPHMSYAINSVISPEFEVGIIKYTNGEKHKNYDKEDQSMTFSVTPSIKFTAGKKATVKVYYNYDKKDKSSMGTTLRVNY